MILNLFFHTILLDLFLFENPWLYNTWLKFFVYIISEITQSLGFYSYFFGIHFFIFYLALGHFLFEPKKVKVYFLWVFAVIEMQLFLVATDKPVQLTVVLAR
jgi:hypothetical protein